MTIAERVKKIANAPQDLFEMFPRYKLDHGIELEDSGETLRLFFVGNANEGWDDCGCFCLDAYDKSGTRYCISYEQPPLKQRKNECDADFADRCAEAIDLEAPYLVECFDADYWTPVLLYDSDEPHDGITISEFVIDRWGKTW